MKTEFIPSDSPSLNKGDRVVHSIFGFGTICEDACSMTVPVVFDDDIAPFRNILWWTLTKLKE